MHKHTDKQHAVLKKLHDAIVEAHAEFPKNRDMHLLHGMAERLVAANKASMTDEQYHALGGGVPKTEDGAQ